MIYPVPHRFLSPTEGTLVSSMGIHTHRNIAGELLIGPSQLQKTHDQIYDYSFETPASDFADSLSHFIRDVCDGDLHEAYVGNRPKLFLNQQSVGDFVVFREKEIIHLLGIESPGLTAAPAIAKHISKLIT